MIPTTRGSLRPGQLVGRAPRAEQPVRRKPRIPREMMTGYLFLLPDFVGLSIFVLFPIAYAFYLSLNKWSGLSAIRWTGLTNYQRLLADPVFFDSLVITTKYTISYVPLLYVTSLGLALLVNRRLPFLRMFRTLFFVPVVLSSVVSCLMWKYILDEQAGLLNFLLGLFGLPPHAWLGSVESALPCIVAVSVWMKAGYFMVIFVAGMQDIPRDYYEAARIDGATRFRMFWSITLPLLKPTTLFVIVVSLIDAFQVFDQVWVLTQGGPASSTQVAAVYIFQQAFRYLNFGYGSAAAFILFVIIMLFSIFQFRLLRVEAA